MTDGTPKDDTLAPGTLVPGALAPDTLADVVLAECSGRAWLVRGEEHIDNLLNNTLAPDISIQVIACESKTAVDALWARWNADDVDSMWMIHPGVLGRVKGNPAGSTLVFLPWSAALDKAAEKVIGLAASAAGSKPDAKLALVRNVMAGATRTSEDLAGLRCTLIEGRLTEAGVDIARIVRESRPATVEEDTDRFALLMR